MCWTHTGRKVVLKPKKILFCNASDVSRQCISESPMVSREVTTTAFQNLSICLPIEISYED